MRGSATFGVGVGEGEQVEGLPAWGEKPVTPPIVRQQRLEMRRKARANIIDPATCDKLQARLKAACVGLTPQEVRAWRDLVYTRACASARACAAHLAESCGRVVDRGREGGCVEDLRSAGGNAGCGAVAA